MTRFDNNRFIKAPGEGTMIQLKLAAGPREQRDAD